VLAVQSGPPEQARDPVSERSLRRSDHETGFAVGGLRSVSGPAEESDRVAGGVCRDVLARKLSAGSHEALAQHQQTGLLGQTIGDRRDGLGQGA
jgi:hypothetical protein